MCASVRAVFPCLHENRCVSQARNENDSSGQPCPFGHHDRLLTEDDAATADSYPSNLEKGFHRFVFVPLFRAGGCTNLG